ncbi:MAG TPA: preprotein translocase subunit YajC [Gammaproteobacteria bacterium]
MSFFISDAYAAGAAPQGDFLTSFVVPMVIIIGGFWFFLMRPQQKRQKEHQQLLSNIAKGDEVVTSSGILGKVKEVGDQFLTVEIASGVEVKLQKQAVGNVLPKGTLKNL